MFILIGIQGLEDKIKRYNRDDISYYVPEAINYIDSIIKDNDVLSLSDQYDSVCNSVTPKYILKVFDKTKYELELFESLDNVKVKYKNATVNKPIYVMLEPDIYNEALDLCDIIMITMVNKLPESYIESDNNKFKLYNISSEFTSVTGNRYYHSIYARENSDLVEMV